MAQQDQHESEWQTCKRRIDPRLRLLGWQKVSFDANRLLSSYHHRAIEEYPTDNGPVDYALSVNGRFVGIVEAKRINLGPQNGLAKAFCVELAPTEAEIPCAEGRSYELASALLECIKTAHDNKVYQNQKKTA